ncbi:MAG: ester cyclase [Planctomycetota bacterium]
MSADVHTTFVERWFEAVWNQGHDGWIDDCVPPDSLAHGLFDQDRPARGPDGFRAFWTTFRSAFSDIHFDIHEVMMAGPRPGDADGVTREVCRWLATAVHTGAFGGVMPTGRAVRIGGTTWMHVRDRQIRQSWTHWDQQGLLDQLAGAEPGA